MKQLNFNNNQCVKIETKDQYNAICHLLRDTRSLNCELKEPIYLEYANSVTRGTSIGIILQPIGTWNKEPLEVVLFENATY